MFFCCCFFKLSVLNTESEERVIRQREIVDFSLTATLSFQPSRGFISSSSTVSTVVGHRPVDIKHLITFYDRNLKVVLLEGGLHIPF